MFAAVMIGRPDSARIFLPRSSFVPFIRTTSGTWSETAREAAEDDDTFVARAVAQLHREAFAPRVDLSQTDANSLDGSNTVARQPLDTMLGIDDGDE